MIYSTNELKINKIIYLGSYIYVYEKKMIMLYQVNLMQRKVNTF